MAPKKSKRSKKVLVINIIITAVSFVSLVFSLVGIFIEENKIPPSLAKLSPYIVILSVLMMALVWLFDRLTILLSNKYDANAEIVGNNYTENVTRLEECINEVRTKYNESILTYREGIIATLIKQAESLHDIDRDFREFILTRLKKYLSEESTGALENSDYYGQLTKLAKLIMDEKVKLAKSFSGTVWAQSSLLEDEWVATGGAEVNQYETNWMNCMSEIDKKGIKTTRLYILSKSNLDLLNESGDQISNGAKELLSKLRPYLSDGTYINTTSYVIAEKDYNNISDAQKLLGAGYFAVTFSDGRSIMVRDVCPTKRELTKLEGSVDYCQIRLQEAIKVRNHILEHAALKLEEFLNRRCSASVKKYMATYEFKNEGKK